MKSNKTTLVMIAAVVVTASAFAFGQGAWSPTGSATDTGGRSATAAGQPGYIEPSTGFVNPGVPTNGAYLPPFGSPNSANGAPSGAVGNTGANGVVGGGQSYNAVGGTNPGGRTAGTTAGTSSGVTTPAGAAPTVGAGSPQASGPLNSAPNGAAGTYGYPNGVDPNGSLNNSGATFRNTEAGRATTSGTTGSINSVPFGTTGNSDIAPTPAPTPR